jgi:hypothetical protein
MFTQGVKPGDTLELKIKAGLKFKAGEIWIEPITGMEFVFVPGGSFQMGSNSSSPVPCVLIAVSWALLIVLTAARASGSASPQSGNQAAGLSAFQADFFETTDVGATPCGCPL